MAALRSIFRSFAHPPWPRWVSLLVAVGLGAYAIWDAFQPPSPSSPVSIVAGAGVPLADKWVHICAYGLLTLTALQGLIGRDGAGLAARVVQVSGRLAAVSGRMAGVSHRLASAMSGRRGAVLSSHQHQVGFAPVIWASLAVALLAIGVAVAAEVIQHAAGLGRAGEVADALVSALGAGLAVVGFLFCRYV